jgi:signal transduction histidine kinase/DNA-binding NarL/FixJ family response regulator
MKKTFILFCFGTLLPLKQIGQNQKVIDSLQRQIAVIETGKKQLGITSPHAMDTSKVMLMINICKEYWGSEPTKGLAVANECLALSEAIGYKAGIGHAYNCLGIVHEDLGKYPEALDYYRKAVAVREKLNDNKALAASYNNIGIIYYHQAEFPEALKNFMQALKKHDAAGNKRGVANGHLNIGAVYVEERKYEKALSHFKQALSLFSQIGEKTGIALTYNNIGAVYNNLKDFPAAIRSFNSALKINEELNDRKGISRCYNNIGETHNSEGKYAEAVQYFKKSLDIKREIGDKKGIASIYCGMGVAFARLGKSQAALINLNKALAIAEKLGARDMVKNAYQGLFQANLIAGDYKAADAYNALYKQEYDSIFNKANENKLTRLQMEYEFDQKESQTRAAQQIKDALATRELQQQKLVTIGFVACFAVSLLFAAVFLRQRNKIKKGNTALQAAKERAERSEMLEKQFLANMSHEIRTPMNAVMGMTNLVLETPLDQKQRYYLEGIKKSSAILLHILNDVLDISKIQAGKLTLENIHFSIPDVAEQVRQTLQHKAEEKGLALSVTVDEQTQKIVIGDPVRLTQVFTNMIGNAIKFTEKGRVELHISNDAPTGGTTFTISDTGIGIAPEKLQTVFESFSQANTSDTRLYGGTGLGLSISRQLVEMMGGTISVQSQPGIGSRFSFTLRLAEGSPDKLNAANSPELNVDGHILDGLRILVIDDNEFNRIVACDTLAQVATVDVTAVDSAAVGIELLKQKKFDVVLMDVQMPVMNGFEATKFIREKLEHPARTVPVIALTASVLRNDLDKCLESGMNSCIAKPFTAAHLITGIAQVLKIDIRITDVLKAKSLMHDASGITNLEYLRTFCENDPQRMHKYVEMFIVSAPDLIGRMETSLSNNDYNEIAAQVHAFKTRWMMMGMRRAEQLAHKIEIECREQGGSQPSEEVLLLINEVKEAVVELTEMKIN